MIGRQIYIAGIALIIALPNHAQLNVPESESPAADELECLLIERADILVEDSLMSEGESSWKEKLSQANRGHQIVPGEFLVISVRKYEGRGAPIDRQTFTKLTLKLPKASADNGPETVIESHYSKGNSGFVAEGSYLTSDGVVRNVDLIDQKDGSTILKVSSSFQGTFASNGTAREVELKFHCLIEKKMLKC